MDLFKIFSEIEKIDGEVYERFDTRRRAFKHLAGLGKTITAATMPALLSTMFNKAYGQGVAGLTTEMKAVLNLALQLEYLEFHFYNTALSAGVNVVPDADKPAITIIRDDEKGHIAALQAVLGADAIPDPGREAFDYTAGGQLGGDPFMSTALFYGTAQSFVDTGVRAYKGGAPALMANKEVLTAALNIHSVEARHSAHVRMVRRRLTGSTLGTTDVAGEVAGGAGNMKPKSWVSLTENDGPKPPLTKPVYGMGADTNFPAEDNTTQGGLNVQSITTYPAGLTLNDAAKAAAASEAFDEPLDAGTVKAIARNFRSVIGVTKGLFV
jgi:hypothetical protein